MRIAICDDRRADALRLASLLEGHRCQLFSGSTELLDDLAEKGTGYDLYLLDIYMDNSLNGIELARKLRELDADAAICFISTSDEFYREAYDLQDVNYLLKPVQEEAFRQMVERTARKLARDQQQSLSFRRGGHTETVLYNNILFISSSGHALDIHCKDGAVYAYSAKLDDVEALLDGSVFLRCHQSFLVNLYQVDHMTGRDLMVGGHRVPISRRYFPDVKRRYQEILFEEVN